MIADFKEERMITMYEWLYTRVNASELAQSDMVKQGIVNDVLAKRREAYLDIIGDLTIEAAECKVFG